MIKIERVVTPSPAQWDAIIRGTRNAKNSWDRMDSYKTVIENPQTGNTADFEYFIGENDQTLLENLAAGGSVHAKYRRMIIVYVDITAPLYWWKEMDTYKVGTTANSCSTMHKIHAKEFVPTDFSCERLNERSWPVFKATLDELNYNRDKFNETKEVEYWEQMIELLPSSYNQMRTVCLNYEVLVGIYRDRKNHKLNEWREFCKWIEELPYSELITGKVEA